MVHFTYINNQKALKQHAVEWATAEEIAVDLECENNLHHYGTYISLIQLSTKEHHWVVDVLTLDNIKPLLSLFKNPKIRKVFHDVNFDLRIIFHQFGCSVKNFFDTQLAAYFLGKQNVGLGSLLEEYFNVKKEQKFQRVDWTARPLSLDKIEYAAGDTAHLLQLKKKLVSELKHKGRLEWVEQECAQLETVDWSLHEQTYLDLKGARSLTDKQRSILKVLFEERKLLAKMENKPPYRIMSNRQLLAFSQHPPRNWTIIKGVHPVVLKNAHRISLLVEEAAKQKDVLPPKEVVRLTPQQFRQLKKVTEERNQIADKMQLPRHLLLSTDAMRTVVVKRSLHHLRPWQQKKCARLKNVIGV